MTPLSGQCQCGAVRYAAEGTDDAVLCHCRMCQRAMGGPFGWMVSTVDLTVTGTPGWFRSSSAADRGFCAACGTPLFFRLLGGDKTWVTGGSLDDGSLAPPQSHYCAESQIGWTHLAADLPRQDILPGGITGHTANTIISNQAPAACAAKEDQ